MPALSAKEDDPHVKAYFQHLVDNGKLALTGGLRSHAQTATRYPLDVKTQPAFR